MTRLVNDWVYGGLLAALALAVCSIGLAPLLPLPLLLVFLLLPAYMLHQAEEHLGNRFRDFMDTEIGKGRPVLSNRDIFLVNVPGVWGVFALCFTLASTIHVGFGLIPAYAALVNVPAHVAPALRMRRPNPGLVTAILILLPLSVWTIAAIDAGLESSLPWHASAIATAVLAHGIIFALAAKRMHGPKD